MIIKMERILLMPLTVDTYKIISKFGGEGGGSLLEAAEHDNGCVPGGAVVDGEVGSGGVHF